jgi:hypothetical protein
VLTGDAGDHTIDASVSGGNIHLAGSNGTTFTFEGTTSANVSIPLTPLKGLDFFMLGGNDAITVNATDLGTISGNVDAFLGEGTNSFTFDHATVTGTTLVLGGTGADTLEFSNDTLHNVSLYTYGGTDSITMSTVTLSSQQVYADLIAAVPSLASALGNITIGGNLIVGMGLGTDTLDLSTVTAEKALINGLWSVSLGAGNNTATLTSVQTHGTTVVSGGAGTHVTADSSTFGGTTVVATTGNSAQIDVNASTFDSVAVLSTGVGNSQTIAVDDSSFKSVAEFVEVGQSSKLNLESSATTGAGTTFSGPVVAVLPGPSATANLGSTASSDKLDFAGAAIFVGGVPDMTVNIATAVTTIDNDQLVLVNAKRVNVV